MVNEIIHHLQEKRDGVILDCTIGSGGHSREILKTFNGECTLIGLDQDPEAIERSKVNLQAYKDSVILKQINFALLDTVLDELQITNIDACIFDLGISLDQLENAERGFSFRVNGPLDMRMDRRYDVLAYDIVNRYSKDELCRIIGEYGEERKARQIAAAIVAWREKSALATTQELATIVERVYRHRHYHRIHPATKTFQALRIAVNRELENIQVALATVLRYLAPAGLVCVISFHSLEDRIVKNTFRAWAKDGHVAVLTKKPLRASEEEVTRNKRSRSAKLRIAKRSLQE